MCIAIVKTQGSKLNQHFARNGYENNSNGAGFAYIENDEVKIKKGFFSFEEFWNEFNPIQENNDGAMLIHFRIATSGDVDEYNCHPWEIDSRNAMIHNGIISDFSIAKSNISDTGLFVENVLKIAFNRNNQQFKDDWFQWVLKESIGKNNKVAILNADGEFVIYNEEEGVWEDGIWFSNCSFRNPSKKKDQRGNAADANAVAVGNDFEGWRTPRNSLFKRNNKQKKGRGYKYHLTGSGSPLSDKEINHLTHTRKKKIKELIECGEVERRYINNSEPIDKKSEDYKNWWMNACT